MKTNLVRIGGIAAILAGALRGLSSVLSPSSTRIMTLYLGIDVLLLISSIGLFEYQRLEAGVLGISAVALEALGASILIARDLSVLGETSYPIGALAFAIGLDLFAIAAWRSKTLPRWILILLMLSTVIGPIGFFSSRLAFLFAVSGLIFAIGFASMGVAVYQSSLVRKNPN